VSNRLAPPRMSLASFPVPQIMPSTDSPRPAAHRGDSERSRLYWQIGLAVVILAVIGYQLYEKQSAERLKAEATAAKEAEKVAKAQAREQAAEEKKKATEDKAQAKAEKAKAEKSHPAKSKLSKSKAAESNPTDSVSESPVPTKPTAKPVGDETSTAQKPAAGKTPSAKVVVPAADKPNASESGVAKSSQPPASKPKGDGKPSAPARAPPEPAKAEKFVIQGVTIKDLDGNVAFKGDIDLTETLKRIDAGERIERFRNDGISFQNREGRLPKKPAGYYREWVHPTPKLPGPGPQRVVTGENGEAYYTADHYKSFKKIR
jgi:ribonuclease T1